MFTNPFESKESGPSMPDSTQRTRKWLDQQLNREGIVSPPSSDSSQDHGTPSTVSSSEDQKQGQQQNAQNDAAQQGPGFSKSFQFVDENDPDPRKTVRKHVMKEFQRERRFQRDTSGKPEPRPKTKSKTQRRTTESRETQLASISGVRTVVSPGRIPSSEPSPTPGEIPFRPSLQEPPFRAQSDPQPSVPRVTHARSKSVMHPAEIDQTLVPYQRKTSEPLELRPLHPQTLLSAGRVDPFDSLPNKSDFSTNALVDHYICTLSYMVFRMATRLDFNPIKDTFKLAVQDPVSFHAIMTYASSHVASLYGMQNTQEVIAHQGKTLQLLTKKLNPSQMDNSDGTIMAVQQLTSVEERWGRKGVAKTHWMGLKQLVVSRGGLAGIRKTTPRLETLIDFTDLATDANQPSYRAPCPGPLLSSLPPPRLDDTSNTRYDTSFLFNISDLPKYRHQFRQFLSDVSALTASSIDHFRAGHLHPLNIPRRLLMFHPGTTLHNLLSAPQQERRGIPFNQMQVYCQMGALVYLSATLFDYRNDPAMMDYFLKTQELNIVEWDLEILPSIEKLVLIFQRGEPGSTLEAPERMWWTGRMMGLLKGMEATNCERVKEMLFRFVTVNCGEAPG